MKTLSVALTLTLVLSSSLSSAQERNEETSQPTSVREKGSAETKPPQSQHPVFDAFAVYARAERGERIASSLGGAVSGGAIMAVGAPLANDAGRSTTGWYAVGGTLTGLSLLALLAPTDAERLAGKHRVGETRHTEDEARALEKAWERHAAQARSNRFVGATFGTLVSLSSVTAGALILNGSGDLGDGDRRLVGGLLLGFGIGGTAASIGHFAVPTRAERMYEAYAATQGLPHKTRSQWCWGLSGMPGGAGLSLSGTF